MTFVDRIKNRINHLKEWFTALGVVKQLGTVMMLGFIVVIIAGILLGSFKNSYLVFIDPPELMLAQDDPITLFFSFILMIVGLIITSFIISVLSASLDETFRDIRKGSLKFYGENHTLIVNYNRKVMKILQELNLLYKKSYNLHEVIILINNDKDIEKLQTEIEKHHFDSLKIFVRFGNTFLWERYAELSINNIHSLIILSDEDIKDSFIRDNNNLRIMNLLFSNEKFHNYLIQKKKDRKQVKAVVEFSDIHHFDSIVREATDSLFLALSPKNVLSSILNLSMINIDFYTTWSQLLSFDGHELYFIDPNQYDLLDSPYKDVLLRHERGVLIGISRFEDGEFKLLINEQDEIIKKDDWLIFIAEDIHSISFLKKAPEYNPTSTIEHPKEIFVKNIAIIGNKRTIETNGFLDVKHSRTDSLDFSDDELFNKSIYDNLLHPTSENAIEYDTVIINLDDEKIYRIALYLKVLYSDKCIERFVFIVDDVLVSLHLKNAGFKNTMLSHLLVSNYMAQVANQLALHKVFNILFVKEGPQINFIDYAEFSNSILEIEQLLIASDMVYLGVIKEDGSVIFEAESLVDVKKIIVLSDSKE